MDLGAVLSEFHFVHELVDKKDSSPMIGINILPHRAAGNGFGTESSTRIPHHNQDASLVIATDHAFHRLRRIFFGAMNHGIGQGLLQR